MRYLLGESPLKKRILSFYKWTYPLPSLALVYIAGWFGFPGTLVWVFSDASTALPIFANILALLLLAPRFTALLRDYQARYLGQGTVDPSFRVFYEDQGSPAGPEESPRVGDRCADLS